METPRALMMATATLAAAIAWPARQMQMARAMGSPCTPPAMARNHHTRSARSRTRHPDCSDSTATRSMGRSIQAHHCKELQMAGLVVRLAAPRVRPSMVGS